MRSGPKERKKAAWIGKLEGKEMFLAHDQESCKVTNVSIETVDIPACNHDEVDTGISLYVKHAAEYGNQEINLISDDTNVMPVAGVSNSY